MYVWRLDEIYYDRLVLYNISDILSVREHVAYYVLYMVCSLISISMKFSKRQFNA